MGEKEEPIKASEEWMQIMFVGAEAHKIISLPLTTPRTKKRTFAPFGSNFERVMLSLKTS